MNIFSEYDSNKHIDELQLEIQHLRENEIKMDLYWRERIQSERQHLNYRIQCLEQINNNLMESITKTHLLEPQKLMFCHACGKQFIKSEVSHD